MRAASELPVVYMLCGFVGSGKTTLARRLEDEGCVRLSIDEWIFDRHGRHGRDYEEHQYATLEAAALEALDQELRRLIAAGRSVVLDYGFWSPALREAYKRLIEEAGGRWRLIYLDVELDEIRRRLDLRNRGTDANALTVTDRHFAEFLTRWQPPSNEGEEPVPTRFASLS